MSEEKVELDVKTLQKLFSLAGMDLPDNIENADVEKLASKLQHDMSGLKLV